MEAGEEITQTTTTQTAQQDTATEQPVPLETAQPFDSAQGEPFDGTQGKPFDVAQGKSADLPSDATQGGFANPDSASTTGLGDVGTAPGATGGDELGAEVKSEKVPEQSFDSAQDKSILAKMLLKCKEVIFNRKQKKLEKILEMARQRNKISNEEVCKELRVSRATAFRYLNELEKQGKLRQVGKTGHGAFYEPI